MGLWQFFTRSLHRHGHGPNHPRSECQKLQNGLITRVHNLYVLLLIITMITGTRAGVSRSTSRHHGHSQESIFPAWPGQLDPMDHFRLGNVPPPPPFPNHACSYMRLMAAHLASARAPSLHWASGFTRES